MNGFGVIMPMLLEMVEGERVVVALFWVCEKQGIPLHIYTFNNP